MKRRILVIDDEDIILAALEAGLGEQYDVMCVRTGLEAMKKIWKNKPDIIITDLNLPGVDGLSLAKNIMLDPGNANIRFILISGYLTDKRAKEWEGIFKNTIVLSKPFTVTAVKRAIEKLLAVPHVS